MYIERQSGTLDANKVMCSTPCSYTLTEKLLANENEPSGNREKAGTVNMSGDGLI
jgi:hypothetical protein